MGARVKGDFEYGPQAPPEYYEDYDNEPCGDEINGENDDE